MSMTSNLGILGAFLMVGAVAFAVLRAKNTGQGDGEIRFKSRRLLTANELEFLVRLEAAMPELRFCPQVAMGALLDPTARQSDRRAYFRQRGMFSQKIVDFVAQRRDDGSIVAIIELDDRTHDSAKDARRDAMLASAGYKVVRWRSTTKPHAADIREALSPPSPSAQPTTPERREPFLDGRTR
jgi:hypothetical protein